MTSRRRSGIGPQRFGATDRAPFFKFFAKEWLLTTIRMSAEERGALVTLLAQAWIATEPCTLPIDDSELASLADVPRRRWTRIGPGIREMFEVESGRLVHSGLRDLRSEMIKTSRRLADAGRRGAEKRYRRTTSEQRQEGNPPAGTSGEDDPAMARPWHTEPDAEAETNRDPDNKTVQASGTPGHRGVGDKWDELISAIWEKRYEGQLRRRRIREALRALVNEHGIDKVVRHFEKYCACTDGQFASLEKFASTFGLWDRARRSTSRIDATLAPSVDGGKPFTVKRF